jgi:hypothetical protein
MIVSFVCTIVSSCSRQDMICHSCKGSLEHYYEVVNLLGRVFIAFYLHPTSATDAGWQGYPSSSTALSSIYQGEGRLSVHISLYVLRNEIWLSSYIFSDYVKDEGRLAWHQPNYCKVEVRNAHEIPIMKCRCKRRHKDYFRIIGVRYNFLDPTALSWTLQRTSLHETFLWARISVENRDYLQPSANEAQLTATRLSNPWNVLGELALSPQI